MFDKQKEELKAKYEEFVGLLKQFYEKAKLALTIALDIVKGIAAFIFIMIGTAVVAGSLSAGFGVAVIAFAIIFIFV